MKSLFLLSKHRKVLSILLKIIITIMILSIISLLVTIAVNIAKITNHIDVMLYLKVNKNNLEVFRSTVLVLKQTFSLLKIIVPIMFSFLILFLAAFYFISNKHYLSSMQTHWKTLAFHLLITVICIVFLSLLVFDNMMIEIDFFHNRISFLYDRVVQISFPPILNKIISTFRQMMDNRYGILSGVSLSNPIFLKIFIFFFLFMISLISTTLLNIRCIYKYKKQNKIQNPVA